MISVCNRIGRRRRSLESNPFYQIASNASSMLRKNAEQYSFSSDQRIVESYDDFPQWYRIFFEDRIDGLVLCSCC